MQKIGSEVPEYGTIQQRMAADIFEYVDPKGRKPVSYTKVMNKYKITQEQVLEEANKINIRINSKHFVVPEDTKRGRPKKEKETETKVKGAKGRPKKDKKVIQIEGDEEDLFATLVAAAAQDAVAQDADAEEEKAAAEAKKAEEKAAKKAAAEQEKAAKKAAAEEEKAAKKAAVEQEKAAKKAAIEEEKAAKKAAAEAKKASKTKPEKKAEAEEEEQPDVVKKIEFEGKKYLKSKQSGIVYDYNKYVKEGDQVIVGKWNDATNKIQFQEEELEEEEEEQDDEEDEDEDEDEE